MDTKKIAARMFALDPYGFKNSGADGYEELEKEMLENPLAAINWLLDYIENLED